MTSADEKPDDREVVVECELDAPPEKVWRALTVPELMTEWIDPAELTDGKAEPSYEMLDALPFCEVRYAWRDGRADAPDTLLTFELRPRPDDRTWFRLTHSAAAAPKAANSNALRARAA